jgi:hypothetical protein
MFKTHSKPLLIDDYPPVIKRGWLENPPFCSIIVPATSMYRRFSNAMLG